MIVSTASWPIALVTKAEGAWCGMSGVASVVVALAFPGGCLALCGQLLSAPLSVPIDVRSATPYSSSSSASGNARYDMLVRIALWVWRLFNFYLRILGGDGRGGGKMKLRRLPK